MTVGSMNHCQIVEESLNGKRAVDEQTFASLAILNERLDRLKKIDKAFANVGFSRVVKKLKNQKAPVAV